MPRKKIQQVEPEPEWVTAREAVAILNENSGRQGEDSIKVPYIRQLVLHGKLTKKKEGLDGRTALYLYSDLKKIRVQKHGKGDTVEARKNGSRRKSNVSEQAKEEATA